MNYRNEVDKKNDKRKVLSCIMPVYNGAAFLRETIYSVLNQPGDDYELIIVNDGSKDNSDQIIKEFCQDPHVKYVLTENNGVSHARNVGIEMASGLYFLFLDQDDIILEGAYNTGLEQELICAWNDNVDAIGFKKIISDDSLTRFQMQTIIIESASSSGKPFMVNGCPIHFVFYSRYLFFDCNIRCFEQYHMVDTDINFTHLLFYYSRNVEIKNDLLFYCWRINTNSVSNNIVNKDIHVKYTMILECWRQIYDKHDSKNEKDALQYCNEMICNLFSQTLFFYHWLFFKKAEWEDDLYKEYKGFVDSYKMIYNESTKSLLNDYFNHNFRFRLKARITYLVRRLLFPLKSTKVYHNRKYPLDSSELSRQLKSSIKNI